MKPIVRIAPSPTGFLHVGTARVALYNWLFAKKEGGKFILRIEDTDIKRSTAEMTDLIIESLKWLGLEWDEELYFQSKRFHIYKKYAEELLRDGICYPCYCTHNELESRKGIAIAQKKAWKYDRKCLNLSDEDKKGLARMPRALRFFVPEGKIEFDDKLHGKLEKDCSDIEDFVILKSDGTPTYNFACVIDDHEFKITHIIRGEDHISNTFKQILLYQKFGWEPPIFTHLPLILGSDRSKLSKRHGAISVLDYREQGILPEALINFLALLGWSAGEDREILSKDELIDSFSLERLSKTPAVFDYQKLEWMNGEYINKLSDEELLKRISKIGFGSRELNFDREYILKVVAILKERMRKLTDFWELGAYFFKEPKEYDKEGIEKHFKYPETQKRLLLLETRFSGLKDFNLETIEKAIRTTAEEFGIKAALIIHPMRLALTGRTVGPSLFHIVEILGKERVVKRLNKAIKFLR
ncbi:glutamate--tRNA ligase [candidate division WOR-3 bacterium]|nr:glutamate--tRNA ligase [candidate division WOR-3 bacterium]